MIDYTPKFSALLIPSLALSLSAMAQSETKSPNILFISIDDLRPQIGAYGHEYMVTPNLDELASKARLFNHQYVQVPTSGASRAAMLTGMYLTDAKQAYNEVFGDNLVGTKESENPETFVHHLRRNGYYTVGMGKISHHGNGHVIYKGSESLELPNSWDRWVNDPDWLWKREDILHAYADGVGRTDKPLPAFEFKDVADESYPDGRLANLAMAELELMTKRKGDEPFFMAVGFYKPHLPFCAPKKYWDIYEGVDIELSPCKDIPQGVDKGFIYGSQEFRNQYSHPEGCAAGPGVIVPDDYARNLKRAYYSALSYTDTQVGKVITKLKELGLYDNTIIVVWGDHGWNLGDKTIWGKHNLFDCALRSTFMIKTPDMPHAGEPTNSLMATIDIYPTLCDLAGITAPAWLDGVSIKPIIEDPKAQVRDDVYSYWRSQMSIKTDRYRFSLREVNGKRIVMLFDHKNDPNETVNIADKNPKIVEQLTKKIVEQSRGYMPTLK